MNQNDIISLRHEIHKHPEISNNEFKTSERITNFISKFNPDQVINLANTGRAFIFNGKNTGKTVMFRAELDALPILENTSVEYSSINNKVAHSCGHDGHMSILGGLAKRISENLPNYGRVILLFQPAEEVEQGAIDIINSEEFKSIEPDYIFALHNIPSVEKHKILIKPNSFTAASKGMTIELIGKTSHAAEPEKGINPANAVSKIIRELYKLINDKSQFRNLALLTFIYVSLGEISFGTSAGNAKMGITLRAFENKDMELLTQKSENIIQSICHEENLELNICYNEVFPATVNSDKCVSLIEHSAKENNYEIEYLTEPFKWSEDVGYFSDKFNAGFFGLGAGIDQPALHNSNYNFPDDIIETGINMFFNIYKKINL